MHGYGTSLWQKAEQSKNSELSVLCNERFPSRPGFQPGAASFTYRSIVLTLLWLLHASVWRCCIKSLAANPMYLFGLIISIDTFAHTRYATSVTVHCVKESPTFGPAGSVSGTASQASGPGRSYGKEGNEEARKRTSIYLIS